MTCLSLLEKSTIISSPRTLTVTRTPHMFIPRAVPIDKGLSFIVTIGNLFDLCPYCPLRLLHQVLGNGEHRRLPVFCTNLVCPSIGDFQGCHHGHVIDAHAFRPAHIVQDEVVDRLFLSFFIDLGRWNNQSFGMNVIAAGKVAAGIGSLRNPSGVLYKWQKR